MYNPVSLSLVNFMSYEEASLEFLQGKTTMIYGKNMDDDGADSNGSGKSALVKAITVALLDVPDASLNKEDYIRDGYREAELTLVLWNGLLRTKLTIQRTISRAGSNKLTIWENDEENTQITSVREGNQAILNMIGINKEDILNYFFINQENSHSFFEATDTNQKAIVARFTNSSLVDGALSRVAVGLSKKSEEIRELELSIEGNSTKLEDLKEALDYEQNERKDAFKEKQDQLSSELHDIRHRQDEITSKLSSEKKQIKSLNSLIQNIESEIPKTKLDEEKLEELEKRLNSKILAARDAVKMKREIENTLAGVIRCPKCKHEWTTSDPNEDVSELKKANEAIEKLHSKIKASSNELTNKIDGLRSKLDEKNMTKVRLNDIRRDKESVVKSIARFEKQWLDCEEDLVRIKKEIVKYKDFSLDKKRIEALKKSIVEREKISDDSTLALSDLNTELEELHYWKINLGIKGFKTFLVNKVLSSLEGYVNYHLTQFRTNLQVKINGFRLTKSGDISEKIDVLVSRDGETWRKYKRHSGGQRQRINVCGILTIHKLINRASNSGGLNMLLLDEFFEGLDAKGQTEILSILNQTDITSMVISHNNADIGAENQVWVNYKDGVSQIAENLG